MTTDHDDTELDPPHSSSPTNHVLQELQLCGYRPVQDEPDPRPLPEGNAVADAVADIFDALVSTLSNTRLGPDLEDLLWSTVNLFHHAVDRIERELDDNERAQLSKGTDISALCAAITALWQQALRRGCSGRG